jgi:two-component system alkaline phosphatase synthesis response regulator PhoP
MVQAMNEIPGRILLLEDEKNVGSTLVERLEREGYVVQWAQNIAQALALLSAHRFDLALLDVGLPDGSGFSVAEELRESSKQTAVIFLTAFGNPEDRVRGLELGAEDYVVKPFHLKELLLRIRNGLKRAQSLTEWSGRAEDEIQLGQARVYFSRFEAIREGQKHALTHKECMLLKLLVERKGQVVSRDEILNEVWSENEFPTTRTIDNFILRLRRLIEADPETPTLIRSVRGVGYQLDLEKARK